MKRISAIVVLAASLTVAPGASAEQNGNQIEDLKREVKALRGEVQALRLALSELAELDRQKAGVISRVLDSVGSRPVVSSAPSLNGSLSPTDVSPAIELSKKERENGNGNSNVNSNGNGNEPEKILASARLPKQVRAREVPREAPQSSSGTGIIFGKVSVPAGEPVAYVYVENIAGGVSKETVVIEQSKKQFVPNWAVIQRGTTVKFPNMDNVYHNVFSRSSGNNFDLGLYNSSEEAKGHTFYEPGPVDVYCNIHPRMSANVLVVPNRHFVKVKEDGTFQLSDVPAGKRKVVAWSPGSAVASDWVLLGGGEKAELALELKGKSAGHKNKDGRPYTSYE